MCSIVKKLKKINSIIDVTADRIINSYDFNSNKDELIKSFQIITPNNFQKQKCNGKVGIYVFKFNKGSTVNKISFNKSKRGAKLRKQICAFKENDVLYIGKSEDMPRRLTEHLLTCPSKTYSLRLYTKYRKYILGDLNVYVYYLRDELMDYYLIIGRDLEKKVAKKFGNKLLIPNR